MITEIPDDNSVIFAPFTPGQVAMLNRFQSTGGIHPFTCGAEHPHSSPTLIAEGDGWHCPDEECSYTQNWAHTQMTDPDLWPDTARRYASHFTYHPVTPQMERAATERARKMAAQYEDSVLWMKRTHGLGPAEDIELVDLVGAAGVVETRRVLRSQADEHLDLHMQIVVVVVTDLIGRILVRRRPETAKTAPGMYEHVAGAVQSGETPGQAAHREVMEETGATLDSLRLVTEGVNARGHYQYLYFADTKTAKDELHPDCLYQAEHELRQAASTHQVAFVDSFFDDLDRAVSTVSYTSNTTKPLLLPKDAAEALHHALGQMLGASCVTDTLGEQLDEAAATIGNQYAEINRLNELRTDLTTTLTEALAVLTYQLGQPDPADMERWTRTLHRAQGDTK